MITQKQAFSVNETMDVFGNRFQVGDRVRSFDFPMAFGESVTGMDVEGSRAAYLEGILEAIGEDVVEGCPRYRIRIQKRIFKGEDFPFEKDEKAYPPLNGIPHLFGGVCFGVVKVVD